MKSSDYRVGDDVGATTDKRYVNVTRNMRVTAARSSGDACPSFESCRLIIARLTRVRSLFKSTLFIRQSY